MLRRSLVLVFLPLLLVAQEKIDSAANTRIRQEEADHSQVMQTLHMLTDRYGPRLAGSPNHEAAAKWAAATLTSWGLKNAALEPWDFGHPGWSNERASGFMLAPVKENLKFEVLSWTPSTKGTVTGSAIQLILPQGPEVTPTADQNAAGAGRAGGGGPGGPGGRGPQRLGPTKEELTAWMNENQAKVAGKMVLIGKAAVVPVNFNPPAMRSDDAQLKARFDPNNANANAGRGGRGGGRGPADPTRPQRIRWESWSINGCFRAALWSA